MPLVSQLPEFVLALSEVLSEAPSELHPPESTTPLDSQPELLPVPVELEWATRPDPEKRMMVPTTIRLIPKLNHPRASPGPSFFRSIAGCLLWEHVDRLKYKTSRVKCNLAYNAPIMMDSASHAWLPAAWMATALPPARAELLARIGAMATRLGWPLYLVGGFVRDLQLGLTPDDFDLVVEGPAPRLAQALAQAWGGEVVVHPAFGTATWTGPHGDAVDLATARTETYAAPAALPQVSASDLASDLRRRDFTINAMALPVAPAGAILDPYHGQADLAARQVRVLHPASFIDDPTRLFRAVRYEQRLGFALECSTAALIPGAWAALAALTGDRLRHELELIFCELRAGAMLQRLAELDILRQAHPALHWGAAEAQAAAALPALPLAEWQLPAAPAPDALYLALLLSGAPAAEVDAALARLNCSRPVADAVRAAVGLRLVPGAPSAMVAQLDALSELGVLAAYAVYPDWRARLHRYLAAWRFVRPQTTGADLIALGLRPGPQFKQILHMVRAARLDGQVSDLAGERALVARLAKAE